ncbi:MAG: PEP/pyruvate-binding domain-containing protein [Bryobacterales bacterium]
MRFEQFSRDRKPAKPVQDQLDELAELLRNQDARRSLSAALPQLRTAKIEGALMQAADVLDKALRAKENERAWAAAGLLSRQIAQTVAQSTDGARNLKLLDFQALLLDYGFQNAPNPAGRTREQLVTDLDAGFNYAMGAGLLSARQRDALEQERVKLTTAKEVDDKLYFDSVRYLARAAEWSRATAAKEFGPVTELYASFEPKARGLLDNLLRSSPALVVSHRLETLVTDAGQAVGVRHSIFGSESGGGVVGLNAGRARAVLALLDSEDAAVDATKIYVIPQTVSDLKPMAGILTLDSGNALSHTQLLAANLGIPNATIPSTLLPLLQPYLGRAVELTVGRRGDVTLREARVTSEPAQTAAKPAKVSLDVSGVNLGYRKLTPLEDLSAYKAGEICGPKAYNLGRLAHMFPTDVSPGLVIPFGVYLAHIERPLGGDTETLAARISEAFEHVDAMRAQGAAQSDIEAYIYPQLARFRQLIREMPLTPELDRELRQGLESRFGKPGEFGVFVRSDTNAEDLPEFTGAGLNLTVPNVVGTDKIIQAIKDVWASPFTERAYEWRSRVLDRQDRVYPSVLLQRTVRSDKSGVIATLDLETGNRDAITINVNEGVSAVVDGGVAESLLLTPDGGVKLLQQARATYRKVADPQGGFKLLPPSGRDFVLQPEEVEQVRALVADVKARYPPAYAPDGSALPWDIELGFEAGKRRLFQIRPLVRFESPQAIQGGQPVRLDEVPR